MIKHKELIKKGNERSLIFTHWTFVQWNRWWVIHRRESRIGNKRKELAGFWQIRSNNRLKIKKSVIYLRFFNPAKWIHSHYFFANIINYVWHLGLMLIEVTISEPFTNTLSLTCDFYFSAFTCSYSRPSCMYSVFRFPTGMIL
jgi:hypothetical protein